MTSLSELSEIVFGAMFWVRWILCGLLMNFSFFISNFNDQSSRTFLIRWEWLGCDPGSKFRALSDLQLLRCAMNIHDASWYKIRVTSTNLAVAIMPELFEDGSALGWLSDPLDPLETIRWNIWKLQSESLKLNLKNHRKPRNRFSNGRRQ